MKRIHFEKIHSTHLFAKSQIDTLKKNPLSVITADYQTKGIGRRMDKWHAPKNTSLLTSFVYVSPSVDITPHISKICALALKQTLSPLHLPMTFKYPNDLLINKKKVSGIITEICDDMLITSIGVNLSQNKEQLLAIDQPATSLFIETNKIFSPENILKPLLHNFFSSIYKTNDKQSFITV